MNQPQQPPPNYPYPYPPQPPQKSGGVAVWVIVIAVVLFGLVALIGIFAVMGIYGTRKYIVNAKQVEAKNSLAMIGAEAAAAYARDGKLCASASSPIPLTVPSAAKYMSTSSEWDADAPLHAGFSCLGFSMSQPQYYQYDYKATATGFTATAKGDLDGDGTVSEFTIKGTVTGGAVVVDPTIAEANSGE